MNDKGSKMLQTNATFCYALWILISKDLEKQFKTKISEKRLRFKDIVASFSIRENLC